MKPTRAAGRRRRPPPTWSIAPARRGSRHGCRHQRRCRSATIRTTPHRPSPDRLSGWWTRSCAPRSPDRETRPPTTARVECVTPPGPAWPAPTTTRPPGGPARPVRAMRIPGRAAERAAVRVRPRWSCTAPMERVPILSRRSPANASIALLPRGPARRPPQRTTTGSHWSPVRPLRGHVAMAPHATRRARSPPHRRDSAPPAG